MWIAFKFLLHRHEVLYLELGLDTEFFFCFGDSANRVLGHLGVVPRWRQMSRGVRGLNYRRQLRHSVVDAHARLRILSTLYVALSNIRRLCFCACLYAHACLRACIIMWCTREVDAGSVLRGTSEITTTTSEIAKGSNLRFQPRLGKKGKVALQMQTTSYLEAIHGDNIRDDPLIE